jgi:hypothetical protein
MVRFVLYQCIGVFRHDENQQGTKAQGLKPRSLLCLYGPTKVVP